MRGLRILCSALLFCVAGHAAGYDDFCNKPGMSAAIRQTVIVIDEHHVYAEANKQPNERNNGWRRFLGNLLMTADPLTLEQNFQARERITVVLARRDGSGTRSVFTGCLPVYNAAEKRSIGNSGGAGGALAKFFGQDELTKSRHALDLFRIRLSEAVAQALDPAALSSAQLPRNRGDLGNNGLVSSLRQGNVIDVRYGVPRLIIYSDLARYLNGWPADVPKIRRWGMAAGRTADLDLKGAEVYLAGASGSSAARDAIKMFFLAAHSELVAASSGSGLPTFQAAPVRVLYYQGFAQYPENRYPIRIRLAVDQNGTAVGSWLSVLTGKEQYVPVHGVLTCQSDWNCEFTGDDIFSQLWNANRAPNSEPVFDQEIPFAGARSLRFAVRGQSIRGAISDALLRIEGVKGGKLEFEATRRPNP
jgi:hypothetical protein